MEKWKDIPNTRGEYAVSSKGRVKNNWYGRILSTRMQNGTKIVFLRGNVNATRSVDKLMKEVNFED